MKSKKLESHADKTDKILRKMVKLIVSAMDYDLGKQLDPLTAEEPEYVEDELAGLVKIARKVLKPLLAPTVK